MTEMQRNSPLEKGAQGVVFVAIEGENKATTP